MMPCIWPTRCLLGVAALGGLFAVSGPLRAADRAVPGQWEYTTTTDGTSRTFTSCMSAEDASLVNGDSKTGRAAAERKGQGRCSVKTFTANGDSVDYTLICGTRTIKSATVYHRDTSEGTLITTTDGKDVTSRVKARRLGDC